MYLRTIKVRSSSGSINVYVRLVKAYRDHGKVSERGPAPTFPSAAEDLLGRDPSPSSSGSSAGTGDTGEGEDPDILDASPGAGPRHPRPVRPTRAVDHQLDAAFGKAEGVPADRAFVLMDQWAHPPPPANIAWPAGWKLTSSAIAGGRRFRAQLAPAPASPGPLPVLRGLVPHPRSARGCQGEDRGGPLYHHLRDLFGGVSSRTWCSMTSPAPTSRAPGRPTSPSTATAAMASRTTSR